MIEVLRSKWRITERRDGATYKTEFIGNEWVPVDSKAAMMLTEGDISWSAPSVDSTVKTIRKR